MREDFENLFRVAAVLAIAVGVAFGARIASHYKAEAFNHVTGANVTADDAFWLDLKVELPPKEDGNN